MHTVISAFDDRVTARRAVDRLIDAGFARDDVHLQQAAAPAADTDEERIDRELDERMAKTPEREIAVDRHVLSSIGHFFTSLFGQDNPPGHAHTYAEAVRRGSSVVVVDAHDDLQAQKAATLLHDMGAIDVDERAEQWRADGWAGPPVVKPVPNSLDRGGVRVFHRPSPEPLRDIMPPRESSLTERSASSPQNGSNKPR